MGVFGIGFRLIRAECIVIMEELGFDNYLIIIFLRALRLFFIYQSTRNFEGLVNTVWV